MWWLRITAQSLALTGTHTLSPPLILTHPGAIAEIYKCASINLCPNTVGQVSARAVPHGVAFSRHDQKTLIS